MRRHKIIFVLIILVFCVDRLSAQTPDAMAILKRVEEKFRTVKDYEARVKIKVDVDFIKIPEKNGTIWFLQPDKIKVKAPGFALLPKHGLRTAAFEVLNGTYSAIYAGSEKINDKTAEIIKVIPLTEQNDIVISTLWVDTARNVILKLESTTRSEGTFLMLMEYKEAPGKFDLPSRVIVSFDIRKNELPLGLTGDFETTELRSKGGSTSRGSVEIRYFDYIVNEGKATGVFRREGGKTKKTTTGK